MNQEYMPGGDDAKKGYEASERKSGIFVITAFDVEDVSVCARVSSSYIVCVCGLVSAKPGLA